MLRILLAVLGIAGIAALVGAEPGLTSTVAVLVAAGLVLALMVARAAPAAVPAALAHPSASIDVSVVPAQCDPDAEGHARPRAPGRGAAAA